MRGAVTLFITLMGFISVTSLKYIFMVPTQVETMYKHKHDSLKAVEFMYEMNDTRLMDIQEGKLAAERGTTEEIRAYGRLMLAAQPEMLNELKNIAAMEGLPLPATLSNEKVNALDELKQKTGKQFDRKFIKMMCKDHKRDLKILKKAMKYEDAAIKAFAEENRQVIEDHLARLEAIKKE